MKILYLYWFSVIFTIYIIKTHNTQPQFFFFKGMRGQIFCYYQFLLLLMISNNSFNTTIDIKSRLNLYFGFIFNRASKNENLIFVLIFSNFYHLYHKNHNTQPQLFFLKGYAGPDILSLSISFAFNDLNE